MNLYFDIIITADANIINLSIVMAFITIVHIANHNY